MLDDASNPQWTPDGKSLVFTSQVSGVASVYVQPVGGGQRRKVAESERARTRVVYTGLFSPGASTADLSKPELVKCLLGSHEYLLQCIEAWATQITVRYGLDVMFDIPGDDEVHSIKITAAVARGDAKPLIVRKADKAAA